MSKRLLNISDLNKKDFLDIISLSESARDNYDDSLKNKNIGLIFEKNSTRTRLSFQAAINQLNGNFIDIRLEDLNLQRVESFEDTFEVMACYLDCIVYRTTDHNKLLTASNKFKKPIINALSDISHPCQAISDIFTLKQHFGTLEKLKIVWLGDLNNVLFSLLEVLKFLDHTKVDIFTDEKIYLSNHKKFSISKNINFHFEIVDRLLNEADCIMTDVYNSMNDKTDKETILKKFQVNQEMMDKTNANTIFMHCLPAKIGSEVTEEVIRGNKSIVLNQAKNRMIAQLGILKWLEL